MDVRAGIDDIGEMLAVVGVKGWRCCVCNMTFPRFFSIDHHMNTDHAVPHHVGAPSLGRIVPSSDQPQDETSVSSTNQVGAQSLESIISSPCHTQEETNLASASLAQAPSVGFSDQNSLAVEHIGAHIPIQTDVSVSHKESGVLEKPAVHIRIKKEPLEYIGSSGQQQQNQHDSFQIVGMREECHESLPFSDSVASNKESSDLHKTTLNLILSAHELLSENLLKKGCHGNKLPDFKEQNSTSSIGHQRHQSQATTAPVEDMEGIEARFDSMRVTRTGSPSVPASNVSGKELPSRNQSPTHDIWNARIHHSLRFKCSCGELIRSKHEFKKHRKACFSKHKTYPCPVCGVVFGQKKGLKQHMHIKGWQTVLCTLCTKQFHDHYALQRHFESAHPHSETSLHAVNTQENVEIHGDQKQASGKEKEDGDVQESNRKVVGSTKPIVVELPSEQTTSMQPLCREITSSRPPLETQMSIITSEEQPSSDTELSIVVDEVTSPSRLSGEITGGDSVIEISDEETDNEEMTNSPRSCERDEEEGGEHSEENSRFAHKWQDRKWRRMCKIMSLHPPCSAGFDPFWAHWGPRGRWGRGMSFWGQHRPPFGPPPPPVSSLPPPPPPQPPHFNLHFPMPPFGRFHGPYHHGDPYNFHHHRHHHHHDKRHHQFFYGRHTDMHKAHHGSCHGCLEGHCEWYSEPNIPQSTEGDDGSQGKHDSEVFSGEKNCPSFCTDDVRETTSGEVNPGTNNKGPRTSTAEQNMAEAGEEAEFRGIDCLFKGGRKKQIFAFLVSKLKEGDNRWYCPDCRQGFDNMEELKVHCAYHHKYKRFPASSARRS
ncbi:hypothetical protein C0Q70_19564 [Pomacea canaliculata]|uniref:C2H2-type domain-containing protein n=1 Tax=Pomacea canaliculata TaxID=400727 RepID=A0A2T7NJQ2_POMCA|nr:uncharacterized protein LOC112577250 [Pomacea canaliculata]PVD21391.1 hypothetical protein C0Q70_19564 [Pomacea canaliculata]